MVIILGFIRCAAKEPNILPARKVLIFSKTKRWNHASIPAGIQAIEKLGAENGFRVDSTTDSTWFSDGRLKNYDAIIFLSTTGSVLNANQQAAFKRYIQSGGGFVGIHSAAATEYDWPWYNQLLGAYLSSHPLNPGVRKAVVDVIDHVHPATIGLPEHWERADEWYNYRSIYPGIKVLAVLDENTYEGGTNGSNHPIAWYHEFDGGRAFYTGGGHEDSAFAEPLFLTHLLGGIRYAMGTGVRDYSTARAVTEPEENRLVKTVLVDNLHQPMELAVADDGGIFFTELATGRLLRFDPKTGTTVVVHQFKVCTTGGTGMIGVALDPHFTTNRFLYLYYSPPAEGESIHFNLSRFTVTGRNTIEPSSEKILLQVPVQEKSGSHHGGSLAWDREGNLYLSTGDSTPPVPAAGYAPLDERPGHSGEDSQRSAANSNDFKGKILRIHPEANGTYTIPPGNLFPAGMSGTKPEIYIMGCRNPYRITVNPKTSVLYWGEPGPDAGVDSARGPRGYDEFNQARKAGNFGWPYFIGNNFPYPRWDYSTGKAGPLFDPAAPVNRSPSSTGLVNLPPAMPAMIWYPYAASPEFPELGEGGRCAMAGEFYRFNPLASSPNKIPEYYDGALFVFDWMRNWIFALRFDRKENYVRSEPFMMAGGDFRRPIDLAFGPDGVMYLLEYGSVYGVDNPDARLVKIEYVAGARPPIARAAVVDPEATAAAQDFNRRIHLTSEEIKPLPVLSLEAVGAAPLTLTFSAMGSHLPDPSDDDRLTYEWRFDGAQVGATEPVVAHSFSEPGIYSVMLKAKSESGLVGTDTLAVRVGNAKPRVKIISSDNQSFFWEGKTFHYTVEVNDQEDGSPRTGIAVNFAYEREPRPAGNDDGSGGATAPFMEYPPIAASDCRACHTVDAKSVGPAFMSVAQKYHSQPGAVSILAKKIIAGGAGNWGAIPMSAHPQLATEDAEAIVRYILSLADDDNRISNLPVQSAVSFDRHKPNELRGVYQLTASYTDKGGGGMDPLTGRATLTFRSAKVRTALADAHEGFERFRNSLAPGNNKSVIFLKSIDLTGIRRFVYEYSSLNRNGEIETHLDSFAGPVIARVAYQPTGGWNKNQFLTATLETPVTGRHNLYFVVRKRDLPDDQIINFMSIQFEE